jgi:hypothetical protein
LDIRKRELAKTGNVHLSAVSKEEFDRIKEIEVREVTKYVKEGFNKQKTATPKIFKNK